jgi:hypothetical protein
MLARCTLLVSAYDAHGLSHGMKGVVWSGHARLKPGLVVPNPTEKLSALGLQSLQLPASVLYAPKVTAKSRLGKKLLDFPCAGAYHSHCSWTIPADDSTILAPAQPSSAPFHTE